MRGRLVAVASATVAIVALTSALPAQAIVPDRVPLAADAGNNPSPVGDGGGTDAAAIDAAQEAASSSAADREMALLRGDREAADMMGWMPSLYTGKWFMPRKEDVRRCIMDRESNFNYRANNGSYFGAYQMSAALGVGATWMMQAEVRKEFGAEAVDIVQALRKLTPDKWNRYWQDRAFWTIWRAGEGANHWSGGGLNCRDRS